MQLGTCTVIARYQSSRRKWLSGLLVVGGTWCGRRRKRDSLPFSEEGGEGRGTHSLTRTA